MFDIDLPDPAEVTALRDVQLIDAIAATSKLESAVQARRLSAIGELWDRRKQQADPECEYDLIDPMEAAAAEIAASMGITSSRATGFIRVGEALRDRLPKVAAAFAKGDMDSAMAYAIVYRTELIEDPDSMAKVDAALAARAPAWTKYSRKKIAEYVDSWVGRFDPAGVREPRKPADNRYLDVRSSSEGMAGIWGNIHVHDAIVFDQRIDHLVATVCPGDPRPTPSFAPTPSERSPTEPIGWRAPAALTTAAVRRPSRHGTSSSTCSPKRRPSTARVRRPAMPTDLGRSLRPQ